MADKLRTLLDVTLTKDEAEHIAAFITEEAGPGDGAVRLMVGDGHAGYGLYAADPEYPDEGAILVKSMEAPDGVPALPALPTTEELERLYEEEHGGHPADFAADVLARWGGWMPGLLGHGGALQEAVKILTERTDGVPVAGKVVTVRQRGASTTEDIIDADGVPERVKGDGNG